MKKWKCTVCGYLHEGDKPPSRCPVCGAGAFQFILYAPLPELLEASLKEAFAGESKAHVRNLAFAHRAEQEGYPAIARLFRAVARAERIHAEEYLKYLEGTVGETAENLKTAFENEIKAKGEIYPPLIKEALEGKREDVAWSFIRARDVEDRHARLYKEALGAMLADREPVYHVCRTCGYIFDGDLPETCPVCRSPRDRFVRVE
ncbi:MAG: rubrerythrin family protein [Desulfobacterota bacterium]|jgi:rubrerythrin|nr:rubrerythrin family protein [Thermodesulfobacteriota bacterium]